MGKLKKVISAAAFDRRIQCCSAILVCDWYGPTVAVFVVLGAEMVYIAAKVFTMPIEEVREMQRKHDERKGR